MGRPSSVNFSSNEYHETVFRSALYQVFSKMQQKRDMVCMSCRRFVRVGDIPSECCKKFGFSVDPDSVVIDSSTGKVTQASPPAKA